MIACSYVSVDMDGNERLLYAAFRETFSSRHQQKRSHAIYEKKGEIKSCKGKRRKGSRSSGSWSSIAISCPGSNGRAGIIGERTTTKARLTMQK